jgi:hypothetical protein
MKPLSEFLKIMMFAAAIAAMAALAWLLVDVRRALCGKNGAIPEIKATAFETRRAVIGLRSFADEQAQRLRDPRNSKAIDAGLQTMAVYNATGRVINKEILPRAMQVLEGLAESSASLNRMVQATDRSINEEIAPEAVRSIQSGDTALKELSTALREASGRANTSLDSVHALLADPAWKASLDSIRSTTDNISGITAEVKEASEQMPQIAKSMSQIAATSSRYRRWILLSQIFSALVRAFF